MPTCFPVGERELNSVMCYERYVKYVEGKGGERKEEQRWKGG